MHPVRLVSTILGLTAMIRPTEGIFPIETMIMVVVAVSAAVPAAVPTRMRLPSTISPTFMMLGMFTVFVTLMIGELGVSGSIGRGPGKPTLIRDGFQTLIIRVLGMFFIGLDPFMARVRRRLERGLDVLFGKAVEELGWGRTSVVCISEMSREIAETLVVRMRLSLWLTLRMGLGLRWRVMVRV